MKIGGIVMMKSLRIKGFLGLSACLLLGLFLMTEALAQNAYTDGQAAQLKASDIKKLKALRAPIAVPTYVPAGYKLKEVGSRVEKLGNFWSVDYGLTYENAKGENFALSSANEGLGDLPITETLTGKNPFFDWVIEVGTQAEPEDLKKGVNPEYETGWIVNKRAYVPAGARSHKQSYRLTSTRLSPQEVLKVMVSLRYLR
jgi:hypothetical protein